MADVIQKIYPSEDVRNNRVLAGVDQRGNKQVKNWGINKNQNITEVEAKYDNRFDEPDPTEV